MASCDIGRILVTDDEAQIRNLFELIITMSFENLKVDKASNGLEAVRLFQEHRHGVILMDLRMPEMDGQQAFLAIRQFCEKQGIKMPPVIFCTGFSPSQTICDIVGTGEYHAMLHKPVRSDEITAVIKAKLDLAAKR